MKHLYVFGFYLFLVLAAGCSGPEYMTPEELVSYVSEEENGLHKSAEANGTKINVTYRPTDLWVHQELDEHTYDTLQISSLRKKYSGYYYFIVSFSRNNKEALHQHNDFSQYSDLVQTMSFRMPDYVTLTTSSADTIPVGDFMLNRTYGMSASTDILFAFNREKAVERDWVQFNLNEFGLGTGNQRFRFSTEDLNEVPEIYRNQ